MTLRKTAGVGCAVLLCFGASIRSAGVSSVLAPLTPIEAAIRRAYYREFGQKTFRPAIFYGTTAGCNVLETSAYSRASATTPLISYMRTTRDASTVALKYSVNVRRPAGTFRVLAVILRYPATTGPDFLARWATAQQQINADHVSFAASRGLAAPIVTFDNTNVMLEGSEVVDPRSLSGITTALSQHGISTTGYDYVMVINIDPSRSEGGFWGGVPANQLFVYMGNFGGPWLEQPDPTEFKVIANAAYHHEIGHSWGWAHEWAWCGNTYRPLITDPVLFGWEDVDGDGIPEILDPTPYGRPAADGDFDADDRGELAVFRPSNGTWYIRYSALGYNVASYKEFQWGLTGDQPVSGDFDGDGKIDLTAYRPANGTWYIRYSSSAYSVAGYREFQWGLPGDMPIAADFDGDNKTDLTAYRPSNGTWYIRHSSQGYNVASYEEFQWGLTGDRPLSADFDGDGKTDLAVYRPSTGGWLIRYSSLGYSMDSYGYFQWGLPGDQPLPADFDGDGQTDLAVYRPSTGQWFIRYSSFGYAFANYAVFQWGLPGDLPTIADFDGDGKAELTAYRPSTGEWYIRYSSQGYSVGGYGQYQWGLPGDFPTNSR